MARREGRNEPNNKGKFGFRWDKEFASGTSFTAHADFVTLRIAILANVLFRTLEDNLTFLLLFLHMQISSEQFKKTTQRSSSVITQVEMESAPKDGIECNSIALQASRLLVGCHQFPSPLAIKGK